MAEFYKVTNISDEPCYMTWNKSLLTDEELQAYEAFKQTPEYIGETAEEQNMRKTVPEAVKVRPFYENLGKDVRIKVVDRVQVSKDASIGQPRYEWKFCIGPDLGELLKESKVDESTITDATELELLKMRKARRLARARQLCTKYEIFYTSSDDVLKLAEKLITKFGRSTRIVTDRQWNESGLKNRERKQIIIEPRVGHSTQAKIVNEGYLVAEEMTMVEVEEYLRQEQERTLRPVVEDQPVEQTEEKMTFEEFKAKYEAEQKVNSTVKETTDEVKSVPSRSSRSKAKSK